MFTGSINLTATAHAKRAEKTVSISATQIITVTLDSGQCPYRTRAGGYDTAYFDLSSYIGDDWRKVKRVRFQSRKDGDTETGWKDLEWENVNLSSPIIAKRAQWYVHESDSGAGLTWWECLRLYQVEISYK